MKININIEAKIIEFFPLLIESRPSEGPIVFSWSIETGIGKDPDFKIIAKSFASSKLKLPLILPLLKIWFWTTGADLTLPSKIIATLFPIFSLVIFEKDLDPSVSRLKATYGRLNSSYSTLASSIDSPFSWDDFNVKRKLSSESTLPYL